MCGLRGYYVPVGHSVDLSLDHMFIYGLGHLHNSSAFVLPRSREETLWLIAKVFVLHEGAALLEKDLLVNRINLDCMIA